jgi:hypothetical protein
MKAFINFGTGFCLALVLTSAGVGITRWQWWAVYAITIFYMLANRSER